MNFQIQCFLYSIFINTVQFYERNISAHQKSIQNSIMFAVLVFILLLNHSLSWQQKGSWTSNANQANVLSEFLMANRGTVEFKYLYSSDQVFLTFNGKDESSETVRVFLKMDLNKSSQTVKLQDYQAELSLYKKSYWKVRRINSTKIFFNITFRMRQSLLFDSGKNSFKVQLLDVEKQQPYRAFELLKIVGLIATLLVALIIKTLIQMQYSEYSTYLGMFSTEIIQLWLIKCLYGIFQEAFYLRDSQIRILFQVFSGVAIFFLLVHFCWRFHTLRKEQTSYNILKIKPNSVGTILYLALFLCLVSDLLPLRLWCILLIPIMKEVFQVFEGKYRNSKGMAKQALMLFALYFFLIAVFPIYSQEISYPKEEASAWWIYAIFYFLEVGLCFLKVNGGVTFLRKAKLLTKQRIKKDYSSLKNYCPICFKSVAFSDIGLAEAGESTNQEWIKGRCEHYFHKKCVKDNINELNQCNIDKKEWTFTLKELNK